MNNQREAMELVEYILQDDVYNGLAPRVVDIAYTAFMIGNSKNGPRDWLNDTKPMVMTQLTKIKKELAAISAKPTDVPLLTAAEILAIMRGGNNCNYNDEGEHVDFAREIEKVVRQKADIK